MGEIRQRLRHLRLSFLVTGLVLLALCAAATFGILHLRARSARWVSHTILVQSMLSQMRIDRLRGEVSLRDYILTGDPADLSQYETLSRKTTGDVARLVTSTIDNPQQTKNLMHLRRLREAHYVSVRAMIPLARQDRATLAARWFASRPDQTRSSNLQAAVSKVGQEEERLLAQRKRQARLLGTYAEWVLLTCGLLIVAMTWVVWRDRRQYVRELRETSERLAEDIAGRREAEEKLELLANNSTDAVFRIGLDGCFLYASPSTRRVFGIDPELVIGQPIDLGVHPEDREILDASLRRLTSGETERDIVTYRTGKPDGVNWRWVESSVALVRGADCYSDQIISSVRDVDHRKQLELQLEDAKARAEAAVVAKSSFLANMSHEIRTPMNGVLGFTDLLLAGELTGEQRRQAELIAESGRTMMRLLNDILDLSKVDSGQMQIADEPFDLHHALNGCGRLVAPALEQKHLTLSMQIDEALPRMVRGDGLRVRQVILNLLGNATKFTVVGGVELRAYAKLRGGDQVLVVEVSDTGIGIPHDRQAEIFDPFVQSEATTAHRFGGTGLGLSISTHLTKLMGGALMLTSEPGEGSCFTLTLPLIASDESTYASDAADADEAVVARPRYRVLVAEDHDINQMLITAMLVNLGCSVTIAPDGAQAVTLVTTAHAEGIPYDLVLMDTQMPVLDGPSAARQIRAAGITPSDLPIVALTANAYAEDIATSLGAGMQAHIAKPSTLVRLGDVLKQWGKTEGPVALPRPFASTRTSLHERYCARREETLAAVDDLIRRGVFEAEELQVVADRLHKLAGSAAMFGEAARGDAALKLEAGLSEWTPDERVQRIAVAAQTLRDAA